MEEPVLRVEKLRVRYAGASGEVTALNGVDFAVGRERVAIVGESGSGKSTIGRAVMRLLPESASITARALRFRTIDLLRADERRLRAIRGRRIAMVLQDPKYSLNPAMTIGQQIVESYRTHHASTQGAARRLTLEMLERVQIRSPERVFDLYPHQVSLGMGQRVMIAMMLIPEPELLIADEPTSALDVTVRAKLLSLLDELIRERGMALLLISHDINLVASFCDRVLIMYAGNIVETCAAKELAKAQHPYTRGLLACQPRLGAPKEILPTLSRDPAWRLPLESDA